MNRFAMRQQVLADIDRDSAHYAEHKRQQARRLSDMKVVAQAVHRVVVVVPDGDANMKDADPYYCVPHEAPR